MANLEVITKIHLIIVAMFCILAIKRIHSKFKHTKSLLNRYKILPKFDMEMWSNYNAGVKKKGKLYKFMNHGGFMIQVKIEECFH